MSAGKGNGIISNSNNGQDAAASAQAQVIVESTDGGLRAIKDPIEVQIIAMFFVQKLGLASAAQIMEKIENIGAVINEHTLAQALEALRARDFLSYASGKTVEGQHIQMYKTTRSDFRKTKEVAHIDELMPNLVSTKAAKELLAELNNVEETGGDGVAKARRALVVTDYWRVRPRFITLDPWLGSQPPCPYLEDLVSRSTYPYPQDEKTLRFSRAEDGDIVINSDSVSGWIKGGLRVMNLGESSNQYQGLTDIKLRPKELNLLTLPIIDARTGKGSGLANYECLPTGQHVSFTVDLPTRGYMTCDAFKMFLATYAPVPQRGLSPARGRRYGKMAMVGFDIIGMVKEESDKMIDDLIENGNFPPEAQAFYTESLKKKK